MCGAGTMIIDKHIGGLLEKAHTRKVFIKAMCALEKREVAWRGVDGSTVLHVLMKAFDQELVSAQVCPRAAGMGASISPTTPRLTMQPPPPPSPPPPPKKACSVWPLAGL